MQMGRWKDNIKMRHNAVGWVVVGCNDVARDKKKLRNNYTLKKDLACRNYLFI